MSYTEFERAVRQIMNYYMGYRRNQKGMELALEKLAYLDTFVGNLSAHDFRDLMKVGESVQLLKMCELAVRSSLERKESGRAVYRRTDYPSLNPELNKPLATWREDDRQVFSWGM